ncbi:acetone carboxylase [Arthrobacter sp.]|jgi:hypothetical protein|uniref:acetone carboxylase n=1 Tax=Arthrobacter sp. TaxID=1667 RepID=UPI00259010E2|nr:acetone carboxylase [Arthrobacter sp.]
MNLLGMTGPDPAEAICSRKGCRNTATTRLLWNNPKIHAPERRKVWLACDDHATWLQDYLQERSLWKETLPMTSEGPA